MVKTAIAIRARPILFSSAMIRALLDNRKTQTRRVITPPLFEDTHSPWLRDDGLWQWQTGVVNYDANARRCPYGAQGDRLWVRENAYIARPNFSENDEHDATHRDKEGRPRLVAFSASMDSDSVRCAEDYGVKQTPSIHMPRWASRLTLEVTEIRVQRVQEISEQDAIAEGAQCAGFPAATTNRGAFALLWNKINGKRGYTWESNPHVWCVTFKRVEGVA